MHIVAILVGGGDNVLRIGRIDDDVLFVLWVITAGAVREGKRRVVHDRIEYRRSYRAVKAHGAATAHPQSATQSLFSRCRRAPFSGTVSLYSPITAPVFDAIVNDTAFAFADGSSCYNPQNEQNIVINPANAQNVVTSSNE